MPRNILLFAGLMLVTGKALALPSVDFTFSSANGGAQTQVSWVFTGDWASSQGWPSPAGARSTTDFGFGWGYPVASPIFATVANRNYTASLDNTVYSVKNLTTSQVSTGSVLHVASYGGAHAGEEFYFTNNLNNNTGNRLQVIPSSGSVVMNIAFSEFNLGAYQQVNYTTFLGSATVVGGTPIPEPSTCGLALGGLALVGAVIRRRKTSK